MKLDPAFPGCMAWANATTSSALVSSPTREQSSIPPHRGYLRIKGDDRSKVLRKHPAQGRLWKTRELLLVCTAASTSPPTSPGCPGPSSLSSCPRTLAQAFSIHLECLPMPPLNPAWASPLPTSSRQPWAQPEPAPPSRQPGLGIHSGCPLPLWGGGGAHLLCPVVKCSLVKANPSLFFMAVPRCAFWMSDGICSRKQLL